MRPGSSRFPRHPSGVSRSISSPAPLAIAGFPDGGIPLVCRGPPPGSRNCSPSGGRRRLRSEKRATSLAEVAHFGSCIRRPIRRSPGARRAAVDGRLADSGADDRIGPQATDPLRRKGVTSVRTWTLRSTPCSLPTDSELVPTYGPDPISFATSSDRIRAGSGPETPLSVARREAALGDGLLSSLGTD